MSRSLIGIEMSKTDSRILTSNKANSHRKKYFLISRRIIRRQIRYTLRRVNIIKSNQLEQKITIISIINLNPYTQNQIVKGVLMKH